MVNDIKPVVNPMLGRSIQDVDQRKADEVNIGGITSDHVLESDNALPMHARVNGTAKVTSYTVFNTISCGLLSLAGKWASEHHVMGNRHDRGMWADSIRDLGQTYLNAKNDAGPKTRAINNFFEYSSTSRKARNSGPRALTSHEFSRHNVNGRASESWTAANVRPGPRGNSGQSMSIRDLDLMRHQAEPSHRRLVAEMDPHMSKPSATDLVKQCATDGSPELQSAFYTYMDKIDATGNLQFYKWAGPLNEELNAAKAAEERGETGSYDDKCISKFELATALVVFANPGADNPINSDLYRNGRMSRPVHRVLGDEYVQKVAIAHNQHKMATEQVEHHRDVLRSKIAELADPHEIDQARQNLNASLQWQSEVKDTMADLRFGPGGLEPDRLSVEDTKMIHDALLSKACERTVREMVDPARKFHERMQLNLQHLDGAGETGIAQKTEAIAEAQEAFRQSLVDNDVPEDKAQSTAQEHFQQLRDMPNREAFTRTGLNQIPKWVSTLRKLENSGRQQCDAIKHFQRLSEDQQPEFLKTLNHCGVGGMSAKPMLQEITNEIAPKELPRNKAEANQMARKLKQDFQKAAAPKTYEYNLLRAKAAFRTELLNRGISMSQADDDVAEVFSDKEILKPQTFEASSDLLDQINAATTAVLEELPDAPVDNTPAGLVTGAQPQVISFTASELNGFTDIANQKHQFAMSDHGGQWVESDETNQGVARSFLRDFEGVTITSNGQPISTPGANQLPLQTQKAQARQALIASGVKEADLPAVTSALNQGFAADLQAAASAGQLPTSLMFGEENGGDASQAGNGVSYQITPNDDGTYSFTQISSKPAAMVYDALNPLKRISLDSSQSSIEVSMSGTIDPSQPAGSQVTYTDASMQYVAIPQEA